MVEVYAEYLFLENFIMNFIILHITSILGKYQGNRIKIVIGAIVAALYSFIIFFPNLHFLLTFSMKLVISMLIIVISFMPYKFKDFIKYLSYFYLISFIFGGTTFALFYFTNFKSIVSNGIFYTNDITFKLLLYSAAVGYILIVLSYTLLKNRVSKERLYNEVIIEFDSKKMEFNALIDTGNSLSDPISNFPVIIVEYSAIKEILPENIKKIFQNKNCESLEKVSEILEKSNWINRFRIIPFSSLGKENGILIGFKPDIVELNHEGNKLKISNIIVAISNSKLSKNGDYNALINPDILL